MKKPTLRVVGSRDSASDGEPPSPPTTAQAVFDDYVTAISRVLYDAATKADLELLREIEGIGGHRLNGGRKAFVVVDSSLNDAEQQAALARTAERTDDSVQAFRQSVFDAFSAWRSATGREHPPVTVHSMLHRLINLALERRAATANKI